MEPIRFNVEFKGIHMYRDLNFDTCRYTTPFLHAVCFRYYYYYYCKIYRIFSHLGIGVNLHYKQHVFNLYITTLHNHETFPYKLVLL